MSDFERAFSKYENTPQATQDRLPKAETAAAAEVAAIHMEEAGQCPMCKSKMNNGLLSTRDIPTYWCTNCRVATPSNNTMFAGV
jgi:transposase-like protein